MLTLKIEAATFPTLLANVQSWLEVNTPSVPSTAAAQDMTPANPAPAATIPSPAAAATPTLPVPAPRARRHRPPAQPLPAAAPAAPSAPAVAQAPEGTGAALSATSAVAPSPAVAVSSSADTSFLDVPKPTPPATPAPAATTTAAPDIHAVRAAVGRVNEKFGMAVATAMIEATGAERIGMIPEAVRAKFIADCDAKVAAGK